MGRKAMSVKRKLFCNYVAQGLSQQEAYSRAYNNDNMSTCSAESSRLMKDESIQEYIRQLTKIHFKDVKDEISVRKNELYKIFMDENESTVNRLRAVDLLNKMDGLYSFTDSTSENNSQDAISGLSSKELRELINAEKPTTISSIKN